MMAEDSKKSAIMAEDPVIKHCLPQLSSTKIMADDDQRVIFMAEEPVAKHCLPHLSSSFCCLSLRTGAAIYGWFYSLAGILAMAAFSCTVPFYIIVLGLVDDKSDEPEYVLAGVIVLTAAVILLLVPLFSISLLVGIYKREAAFMKPFIVMLSVSVTCDILFSLVTIFADVDLEIEDFQVRDLSHASSDYPSASIVRTLIGIHSLLVINSYHTVLRSQSFGYKLQV